jgi:tetratricopeptide (TPR) repeat protein
MQTGDHARAREVLESYIQTVPSAADDNDIKLLLSIIQYNVGDYEKSVRTVEQVISSARQKEVAIYTYCDALIKNNDYDRLVVLVKNWIDKYQDQRESFAAVAENALSQTPESISAAEKILLAVIEKREASASVLNTLAVLYHSTQKSQKAVQTYRKVLSLEPDMPVAVNNLSWLICEYENEPEKALKLAERGVEQFGDYVDLIDTRGMIYYRLGEFEKALDDFNKCIELYSPYSRSLAGSYYHRGLCQTSMGNTVGARESLLKALKVHSKNGGLSASQSQEIHNLLNRL